MKRVFEDYVKGEFHSYKEFAANYRLEMCIRDSYMSAPNFQLVSGVELHILLQEIHTHLRLSDMLLRPVS